MEIATVKDLLGFLLFIWWHVRDWCRAHRPRTWRRRFRRWKLRRKFGKEITIAEYWRLIETGEEDIRWTGLHGQTVFCSFGTNTLSGYCPCWLCCVPRISDFR